MASFGENLKFLRIKKNITQDQLASDFNRLYGYSFNKTSISQFEHNKRIPELKALISFSEYFHVSLDYLLGLSLYDNNIIIKESTNPYNTNLDEILYLISSLLSQDSFSYNGYTFSNSEMLILKDFLNLFIKLCNSFSIH